MLDFLRQLWSCKRLNTRRVSSFLRQCVLMHVCHMELCMPPIMKDVNCTLWKLCQLEASKKIPTASLCEPTRVMAVGSSASLDPRWLKE